MGNGNKLRKSIMIKMQFMLTMSCLVLFMYMYFVVSWQKCYGHMCAALPHKDQNIEH